jgi:hypothetical protein
MQRPYFTKTLETSNQDYELIFEAFPEDLEVAGQFDNPKDVLSILKRLDSGDESAWFLAAVTMKLKGTEIKVTEYLGGCSYKSFEDFFDRTDCYFGDMVKTTTEDLEVLIKEYKKKLDRVNI